MVEQAVDGFTRDTRVRRFLEISVVAGAAQGFPGQLRFLVGVRQRVLTHVVEAGLQIGAEGSFHFLRQFPVYFAAVHQDIVVHFAGIGVVVDERVQIGLGKTRFVAFVMAVFAIAHHVDEHVGVELLAVLGSEFHCKNDRLRVVAVHVKHGRLHYLGDLRAVGAGTAFVPAGGEPDLVVDDEMDRAAGVVARQLAHLDDLVHEALVGQRGVTVDQDRENVVVFRLVQGVGLGPGKSQHHGIDGLQVRGIGQQFEVHLFAMQRSHLCGIALVVFHIARAEALVGDHFTFKFTEDLLVGFAQGVGQHVQAAAVRHADHNFLHRDFGFGGLGDDSVERGNGRFATFEREPFLSDEFGVEKLLEQHRAIQFLEDTFFLFQRKTVVAVQVAAFHFLPQPVQAFFIVNMRGFKTEVAAIQHVEAFDNFTQGCVRQADFDAGSEPLLQLGFAQAIVFEAEPGLAVFSGPDGVGGGEHVPAVAITVDEAHDGKLRAQAVFINRSGAFFRTGGAITGAERKIEALEKEAPVRFHGRRVGKPGSVQ